MANIDEEYVKITLSNKGIMTNPLDKNNNPLPPILDKGMLSDLDKHLRAIKQTILSASNFTAYFNENMKKINEVTGEMVQSFFVRKSDLTNVISALKRKDTELSKGKTYFDFNNLDEKGQPTSASISYLEDMKVEDVKMLTFKRKRAGKIAQSLAGEAVHDYLGGKAYFSSPKDRDAEKMSFDIPVTESEINALGGMKEAKKHYSKILTSVLKDSESTKYSSAETKKRKEEEEVKKIREEEKEKAKEEREEKAERKENRRKTLSNIIFIVTVLTAIADIARRILSATLARASEVTKEDANAIKTGVNPFIAQKYKRMEKAVGLDEGTMLNASRAILQSFGQEDKIDEGAMGLLANVIKGTGIEKAIRSGKGGARPDEVAKDIINAFYNQAMQGKDWSDNYVGRESAFINLIDRLGRFSPDMANVLSTMYYLNTSELYKGKIKSFDDLINLQGEQSEWNINRKVMENLGIEIEGLTAKIKTLKENILDSFGSSLLRLVDWIDNSEIFMTESKKFERRMRNKQLNEEAYTKMTSLAENAKRTGLSYFAEQGIKASDLGIKNINDIFEEGVFDNLRVTEGLASAYREGKITTEQYNTIQFLRDYYKRTKEKAEKAEKANKESKIDYDKSAYTPATLAMEMQELGLTAGRYGTDFSDFKKKYESLYGSFSWDLLKDSNFSKQVSLFKEGKITEKELEDYFIQNSANYTGNNENIHNTLGALNHENISKIVELTYLQSYLNSILPLFKEQNVEVRGSSFNPSNRTVTFELDVNGVRKNIGVLDTSNGDFRMTGGNIGDKVIITSKDLENAMK